MFHNGWIDRKPQITINDDGTLSIDRDPAVSEYPNPFTDALEIAGEASQNKAEASQNVAEAIDKLNHYFEGFFTNQGFENELNRQFNSAEALKNREFQAKEAQLQRDWYESMSNSAYTRAVADMKNAGINPILAYAQGGAASSGTGLPSSSAASYNSTGGDTVSSLLSAVADIIYAISGASAQKVSTAFKKFRMAGG